MFPDAFFFIRLLLKYTKIPYFPRTPPNKVIKSTGEISVEVEKMTKVPTN